MKKYKSLFTEDKVSDIASKVESQLGDVIDEDMSEKEIKEEAWTLVIDACKGDAKLAKKVMSELGY
jgi:hypothetical protein